MKYTIRKGLESPCKIRGFLSSDYWILVSVSSGCIILLLLGLRSGIMTGDWSLCFLSIIGFLTAIPLLINKFRKNARSRKFDETKKEFTVSNFHLNKIIHNNESRRSL